jgi:hypothetical protein
MAKPENALAIARQVATDGQAVHRISVLGMAAVCDALLTAHEELKRPAISTELHDAARALIAAEAAHTLAKGPDGYAPLGIGLAREMAFLVFKRLFEEEFSR